MGSDKDRVIKRHRTMTDPLPGCVSGSQFKPGGKVPAQNTLYCLCPLNTSPARGEGGAGAVFWTNHPQWPLSGDVHGTCPEDCQEKMPGLRLLMDMVAPGVGLPLQSHDGTKNRVSNLPR